MIKFQDTGLITSLKLKNTQTINPTLTYSMHVCVDGSVASSRIKQTTKNTSHLLGDTVACCLI